MSDRDKGFDHRNYVNFDNTTPENPKIAGLSDAAFRAWFDLVCYCNRQETDGKVEGFMLKKMCKPRVIRDLESARCIEPHPADSTAVLVHDYLRHNRSHAELTYLREAKSDSGARGSHARWHVARRRYDPTCAFCQEESGSA